MFNPLNNTGSPAEYIKKKPTVVTWAPPRGYLL